MNVRFRLPVFLLTVILASPARAYDYPLSAAAVREAYFFGRSTDRREVAEFLGQYIRRFRPRTGRPCVGGIELRTPYEQVVLRSSESQTGYSAQQAQIDYAAHPDLIQVRVFLWLGGSQAAPPDLYSDRKGRVLDRRENFWREFGFRVMQEHVIEPRKIVGQPLYGRRGQGLAGAEVELDFDASEFTSREMHIEVIAPDGGTTVADFALDRLK